MSHAHDHHIDEDQKVTSTGAFYFVLLFVGLVIGIIGFVQAMSAGHGHEEEHHGTAADHNTQAEDKSSSNPTHAAHGDDANDGHGWEVQVSLEYSSLALMGGKDPKAEASEKTTVTVAPVNNIDSAATQTAQDSTATPSAASN